MEEKLRFVFEYERGERSMTELCQQYEIARGTGYVWLRRYRQTGVAGLVERSRGAQRHRNQTPEEIEQMVMELRQAHMRWGPRKLKRILERDEPGRIWPAASTIGALLKREGRDGRGEECGGLRKLRIQPEELDARVQHGKVDEGRDDA